MSRHSFSPDNENNRSRSSSRSDGMLSRSQSSKSNHSRSPVSRSASRSPMQRKLSAKSISRSPSKKHESRSPSKKLDSRSPSRKQESRSPSRKQESRSPSRKHYSRSLSRSNSMKSKSKSPMKRKFSRSPIRKRSTAGSSRSPVRRNRSRTPPRNGRNNYRGDKSNPDPSKCIGIFGLSLRTRERDIADLFEKYGRIDRIQLVTDRYTNESRGFCFVNYDSISCASKAIEKANGMDIDGKCVRIDYSLTKRPHDPTPGQYMGRESNRSRGRYDERGYGGDDRRNRRRSVSRSPYRGNRSPFRGGRSPRRAQRSPRRDSRSRSNDRNRRRDQY